MRVFALIALVACSNGGDEPTEPEQCQQFTNAAVAGTTGSFEGATTYFADLTPVMQLGLPQYWTVGMRLVPGRGVFKDGVVTGTFSIKEFDPETCGLCVTTSWWVMGGHTGFHPRAMYQADSGTITLTSLAPVTGSMQDVHMPLATSDLAPPVECTRITNLRF